MLLKNIYPKNTLSLSLSPKSILRKNPLFQEIFYPKDILFQECPVTSNLNYLIWWVKVSKNRE